MSAERTAPDRRIALVTGAAGGIGLAIATALADAGHTVVLADRSDGVHAAASTLAATGASVEAAVIDLGDPAAIEDLTTDLAARHRRCDVLVNNAGITGYTPQQTKPPILQTSLQEWNAVFRVNLDAPFLLSKWALGLMVEHGWGRIINISSRAARMYMPVAAASYGASKLALIGLTRALAGEGGPYGVTANAIAPGMVTTALSSAGDDDGAARQAFTNASPLGRPGHPDEIAAVVAFLASDASGYVNGAVMDVNGGVFG